ncbi:class I SAM-dependent RNA methyltransferase [Frankia sp. CiP3]|uniref:class I SAM-dependent RNA methyltransferase n=1 Tax=Frankia sp. CiP3 TaxID=2880971 RepID=UPI001EF41FAB|nr:TRAM domain-containing protein [Frankia sp. CiP3]
MSGHRPRPGVPERAAGESARVVELDIGPVAHGGMCVARHHGRVVFVRHTLPGERVRACLTDTSHDRYWRADAVEVLRPSADRVTAPCPHAGPGRCGGCDWQHTSVAAQRRFKAEVVREQLRRLAGLDWPVEVEALDPPPGALPDGLGWRTRMRYTLTEQGEVALRGHRSHETVAAADCRIAHPLVRAAVAGRTFPAAGADTTDGTAGPEIDVAASVSSGSTIITSEARAAGFSADGADTEIVEVVRGRRFILAPGVFWQVHPGAPEALVDAVLTGLAPRAGERALDLYAGAGLFTAALAEAVGPGGLVVAMESDPRAVASAARSLADLPQVSLRGVRVSPGSLRGLAGTGADIVVLDPPRAGAGTAVMRELLAPGPRAVVYVACDPASLGRDLAVAVAQGYSLVELRAFDLFPMTAHVECVALLHGPV